jgi:hypothetical protein
MSAGSAASNLGYGNVNPYNNSPYVNGTSSNYSGSFSSNEIPGTPPGPLPGLAGAKSNVDAAAGKVPGICMNGGSKTLKRKIKNITKYYKRMKAGSRQIKSIKRTLRSRVSSRTSFAGSSRRYKKSFAGSRRKSTRRFAGSRRKSTRRFAGSKQRGGYAQYQNNLPMTPAYQVAGVTLPASQLGLANPPPITTLSNCVNCIDNMSRFPPPGTGFPSKGH